MKRQSEEASKPADVKGAEYAEVVLVLLDALRDVLEGVEVVDLVHALDDGVGLGGVVLEQGLVVDQAVRLDDVDGDDGLILGSCEGHASFVLQMLVERGVLEVGSVLAPRGEAHGAVDLEDRGGSGLDIPDLECALIGAGGAV